MIEQAKHGVGHVSDGDLVRLMDGACEAAEARGIEDHMASCSQCRARLERTRVRFGRLSEALAMADFPGVGGGAAVAARAPGWRPATRRIAASIAVLLGAALAFSPVRAWVGQGLARILPEPAAAPVEVLPPDGFSVVAFDPQGPVFTIEVTQPQAGAALVLELTSDTRVSARTEGGGGREELVVLPSGLRVETGGPSGATFHVSVPVSLSTVVVRVGGVEVRRIDPSRGAPGDRWTVQLGG